MGEVNELDFKEAGTMNKMAGKTCEICMVVSNWRHQGRPLRRWIAKYKYISTCTAKLAIMGTHAMAEASCSWFLWRRVFTSKPKDGLMDLRCSVS
jgi:hypothetical protein